MCFRDFASTHRRGPYNDRWTNYRKGFRSDSVQIYQSHAEGGTHFRIHLSWQRLDVGAAITRALFMIESIARWVYGTSFGVPMAVPAVCRTKATAFWSATRSSILGNLQWLGIPACLRSRFGYTGIGSEAKGDEGSRFNCVCEASQIKAQEFACRRSPTIKLIAVLRWKWSSWGM